MLKDLFGMEELWLAVGLVTFGVVVAGFGIFFG